MAVLGASLTQTIVVLTREAATITAKKCKHLRLHGVSIDILEEITPPMSVLHSRKSSEIIARGNVNDLVQQSTPYVASVVSLLDCVTILNCVASPAINRRLQNWRYFDGIGRQVMV